LNEIARIATLDLELRPMLQRITDALSRHFDWQLIALVAIDRGAEVFVCEAVTSSIPTSVQVGYTRPIGTGVVGEVANSRMPLLIDDVRAHANFVDTTPGVLSEICVPIEHKGELVALLNIESTRLAAFHDQMQLLKTVAEQVAGAIASARMFEELKQRARLMEMMSEVSRTALDATNLDNLLDRVAEYVHARFPLEIVSILLHEAETREFVAAADAGATIAYRGKRWPVTAGIVGRCIRRGITQIVHDVSSDPDYINVNDKVVAELVVPIRHREEILGVFNLEAANPEIFTPANVLAFEAFADQIAGALKLFRTNEELAKAKAEVEQQKRDLQLTNESLTGMVEKFHSWSAHDSLTALHNRSHFDKIYPVEWRRASRSRVPLSLLFADIDHFKEYNDAHGHLAGDECLRRVAEAIAETIHRADDVVARYGGEEFAILLPYTDRSAAAHLAEMLRQRVESLKIEHPESKTSNVLTISIGVATAVPEGDERYSTALKEAADRALYAAKRGGRNRVVTDGA
jgi:diguanylate cyclase (GGDEF)-like protein